MKLVSLKTLTAGLLLLTGTIQAQDTWSLERCVRYASDNNLSVKQAKANVRVSQISHKQAKAARYPNVSANANFGEQFGYTIDPTTNQFNTVATGFNSLGLNANLTLFNGGFNYHNIKQAGYDLKASEADATQTENTLALNVAAAYLSILLSEEQAENAQRRVDQSRSQLSVTQKLIAAGTLPQADQYTVMAQLARDEQTAVQAQNTIDLNYLSLKQLLLLEPDFDLRIERPDVLIPADANPDGLGLGGLYGAAQGTQTSIAAADYRVKSAEEGIALARSAYYPTIGFGVNLSSNYSTAFKRPQSYLTFAEPTTPVRINGVNGNLQFVGDTLRVPQNFKTVGYFDQIDQNFGQGLGLNVSIPIYQNGRTRLSVERARLNVINAQLQQNQVQQQLKNDIQTALANSRAARRQYEAAQKTAEATQIAYQNTEKRHALGTVNSLDLITARNNKDISENDLVVARYDYLFKLKILDFYQGKPLGMERK
jgi:outer membrane protein